VCGKVVTVHFASPNFSAGRLLADDCDLVSFAGPLLARTGDRLVLAGAWEWHTKFGRQLKVERFRYDLRLDREGIVRYLAEHPRLKGIGPTRARAIADGLGDAFEETVRNDPARVAAVGRIPLATAELLRDEWTSRSSVNHALAWLSSFGLTHHQVTTLVEKYGNNSVAILKEDPYLLVRELPGFGFKRVDHIARQTGTAKEHPGRLRAGVLQCVNEALDAGHTWTESEDLVEAANGLLVLDGLDSRERIRATLDDLLDDGALAGVSHGGRLLVARPDIRRQEAELATALANAGGPNPHAVRLARFVRLLDDLAPTLNDDQRDAVRAALTRSISLLTGGAGSGKTFTIATIARLAGEAGLRVVLAAPTGKAAQRMEEVVGLPAFTLHRLLGFNGRTFAAGPEDPVDADLLIVDETSMVDVPLAWQLFHALDRERTAVVFVGDHNQLPPVGPGNPLRDLFERGLVPTVVLRQVVRQAGSLKENSLAILRGEVARTAEADGTGEAAGAPKAGGTAARRPWYVVDTFTEAADVQRFLVELYEGVLVERLGFDLVRDVQLLTPTRKGPLGVEALNALLQRLVQQKLWGVAVPDPPPGRRPPFLPRDKVIQRRNNYELGVMNGTIGQVREVDGRTGDVVVGFDGREVRLRRSEGELADLHLAYALTIHSAQGSEFPCTVAVVHKSHAFMHHRNLFYTAVTRARETAIVVGDRWGIRNCAERRHLERRRTLLSLAGTDDVEVSP
jgi:exodeoxyribonuclease V alpha subunit